MLSERGIKLSHLPTKRSSPIDVGGTGGVSRSVAVSVAMGGFGNFSRSAAETGISGALDSRAGFVEESGEA
jgi:hypothetical protein